VEGVGSQLPPELTPEGANGFRGGASWLTAKGERSSGLSLRVWWCRFAEVRDLVAYRALMSATIVSARVASGKSSPAGSLSAWATLVSTISPSLMYIAKRLLRLNRPLK